MTTHRARRAMALLGAAFLIVSAPQHPALAQDSPAPAQEARDAPLAKAVERLDAGDLEGAEALFRKALAGDLGTQDRAAALIYLARIQLGNEAFAEADATARTAIEELSRIDEPRNEAMMLALMIRFEALKGQGKEAEATEVAKLAAGMSARQDRLAWSTDRIPGAYIHKASGTVLPEAVAGLAEYQVNTYDAAGLDASLTYAVDDADVDPADGPAYVTTYVTVNLGRTLEENFQSASKEIREEFPDAREITSGPIAVKQGDRRLEGRMGVFMVRGGSGQVFSTIHVFRLAPDIHVKFKAMYPVVNAEAMRGRVAALMQTMVWPEGSTIQ